MPSAVATAAQPRHRGAVEGWGSGAGRRRPRRPLPRGFSTLKLGNGVKTLPRPTVPPCEPRPPRRRRRAANQPRCWFPAVVYFTDKGRRGRVLHGGSHPGRGSRSHQCPRAGAASAAPTARQRGLGDNRSWGVLPAEKRNLHKRSDAGYRVDEADSARGAGRSHLGEAGEVGDAAGVVHVPRQQHVALVAPLLAPAARKSGA